MRSSNRLVASIVSTVCIVCIADLVGNPSPGAAATEVDPFFGLQGGVHFWPAYSNRDQVEADTNAGFGWSALGGLDFRDGSVANAREAGEPDALRSPTALARFARLLGTRLEFEVGQRFSRIHGINDKNGQRTGDGKNLRATTAHLNLWPSIQVSPAWRIYLGAGGGATWLRALGSDKVVASAQIGTGVLIDLPVPAAFGELGVRLDIGWRSFFADSVEMRGRLTDFDAHGVNFALHLVF